MFDGLDVGEGLGDKGIYISKKAKNKINIKLEDTGENYDVDVNSSKCQLTFHKSLKDSKGNMRVSFKVQK